MRDRFQKIHILVLKAARIVGYYENSLQGYDIKSRDKWLSRNLRGTFLRENSGNQRSEVEDGETPGPRRLEILKMQTSWF